VKKLEELNEEQSQAYGLAADEKRKIVDASAVVYVARAPDGKVWLVEGMEDAKAFLQKYGRY